MPLGETLKQLAKLLPVRHKPGPAKWGLHLSPRELTVVECIADGMTDKDIAYALHLTIATTKVYISLIYRKLLHLPGNARVGVALRVAKSRYVCPQCGAEGPDLWLTLRDE